MVGRLDTWMDGCGWMLDAGMSDESFMYYGDATSEHGHLTSFHPVF